MQPRGNRRGGGGGGGRRHDDPNVKISKNLSYLLRHGAEKEGLAMRQDGFVKLDDILAKDFYKSKKIEFAKVKEIVDTNDKKRFELKEETGEDGVKVILIRATQGHSIDKINDEELLEKIVDHTQYPNIIHGTQKDAWAFIKQTGLSKMGRNHVHFAIGYPDDGAVISGMRKSCDVYVEVDLEKCIKEGVPFFVSKNKVVLSAGVNGFIRPNYFKKVLIRTNGALKEVDPKEYEWNPQNQNVQVGGGNAGGNNNANNQMAGEEEAKIEGLQQQTQQQQQQAVQVALKEVKQDFDYLCVLDFEANCDDKSKLDVQEIIEFPIVVVDTKKNEIIDKFQTYVKPVVHPKLSGFCTELTGITQDKVDNGVILEEALKKVEAFLKEKNLLTSKHVFVTCGDWDLSICLKQEALAKKITVPDYLKSYINIKKLFPTDDTYRKKYKKTLPGMAKMLELAKLELLGRHHSGIDDSINIARVGIWMMQHGVNFSVRNVSNPKY